MTINPFMPSLKSQYPAAKFSAVMSLSSAWQSLGSSQRPDSMTLSDQETSFIHSLKANLAQGDALVLALKTYNFNGEKLFLVNGEDRALVETAKRMMGHLKDADSPRGRGLFKQILDGVMRYLVLKTQGEDGLKSYVNSGYGVEELRLFQNGTVEDKDC